MTNKQICSPVNPGKKFSERVKILFYTLAVGLAFFLSSNKSMAQTDGLSLQPEDSSEVYTLSYAQPVGLPYGDTTVSFEVYVTTESQFMPDLQVTLHPKSWLFDSGYTSINVVPNTLENGWASFSVEATRTDGIQQWGNGPVLRLTTNDGIGVIVLDFPGKRAPNPQVGIAVYTDREGMRITSQARIKAVELLDPLVKRLMVKKAVFKNQVKLFMPGHHGIVILKVLFEDGSITYKKVLLGFP